MRTSNFAATLAASLDQRVVAAVEAQTPEALPTDAVDKTPENDAALLAKSAGDAKPDNGIVELPATPVKDVLVDDADLSTTDKEKAVVSDNAAAALPDASIEAKPAATDELETQPAADADKHADGDVVAAVETLRGAAGGAAAGFIAGAALPFVGATVVGGMYGHHIAKLDREIEEHKDTIHKLELAHAAHSSRYHVAMEDVADETATTEGVVGAAVLGGLTGAIGTGYLGHKWHSKKLEGEAIKADIAKKKQHLAMLDAHRVGLIKSHDSAPSKMATEAIGTETLRGAAGGAGLGFLAGAALPVVGGAVVGGVYGHHIAKLDKEIAGHKEKIHELELAHASHSSRDHVAMEAEGGAVASVEGTAGGAALGFFGGPLGTGYLGHKWHDRKLEAEALKADVERHKEHLAKLNAHRDHLVTTAGTESASTETVAGAVGGAVLGGAASMAVPLVGGAVVGGVYGHHIAKLDKEMIKHKEELHALELAHANHPMRDHVHTESVDDTASTEGTGGGAALGFFGGPLGTGYLGHKWHDRHLEAAALRADIAKKKKHLANLDAHRDGILAHGAAYAHEMPTEDQGSTEDFSSTENFKGAAAGAALGLIPGGAMVAGGVYGHHIAKADKHIAAQKEKLHHLKLAVANHTSRDHVAMEGVKATASTEGTGSGIAIGALGGSIGSGYLGHKWGDKKLEKAAIDADVHKHETHLAKLDAHRDALVKHIQAGNHPIHKDQPSTHATEAAAVEALAALEALEEPSTEDMGDEPVAATEGTAAYVGKSALGATGAALSTVGLGMQGLPGGGALVGATLGASIAKLHQQAKAHRAELAELQKQHDEHPAHLAANESVGSVLGQMAGGVGGAVVGQAIPLVGNVAMGTYMGAKSAHVDDLAKKIEAKKAQIAELDRHHAALVSHHGATEGVEPATEAQVADALAACESMPDVPAVEPEVPEGVDVIKEECVDEIACPSDSAEDALISASDAACDVDDAMEECADLESAAYGLESVLVSLATESNGLDQSGAKFAALTVDAHVGKWQLPNSLCPSIESFGGTLSKRTATASLEANVGDVLKKIYEYVKEMFWKVVEAVKAFLARIFVASEALYHRADKLAKVKVVPVQGAPLTIDVGSIPSRLSVNGKLPATMAGVFKQLDELFDFVHELDGQMIEREVAAAGALLNLAASTDEGFKLAYQVASKSYADYTRTAELAAFKKVGDEMRTKIFPGEVYYVMEVSDNGANRYMRRKNEVSGQLGTMLKTLDPAQITAVAVGARDFAKRVNASKLAMKANGKPEDSAFMKALKEKGVLSEEHQRVAGAFVQRIAGDISSQRKLVMDIYGDGVKAALAALSIAEKSVKALSSGSKTPAKGLADGSMDI